VLHDADEIARRCVAMATGQPVADVDGGELQPGPCLESACTATPRAPWRSPARPGRAEGARRDAGSFT
jgi:hypothetical protein